MTHNLHKHLTHNIKKNLPIFSLNIGDPFELEKKIPEFRKLNPRYHLSNVKAWHSSFFTYKETTIFDDCINYLVELSNKIISEYYDNLPIKHKCIHMWVMEYHKGDHSDIHCHYPADWSLVYYINADKNSSPILLENQIEMYPEPGLLLIFPGIIEHMVPKTKSFRRAIAMNLMKDL